MQVGAALDFELNGAFAGDQISQQLKQVAKLINVSADLRTERGGYFVSLGGFDTHSDNGLTLEEKFGEINAALRAFVDEIKSQGRCAGGRTSQRLPASHPSSPLLAIDSPCHTLQAPSSPCLPVPATASRVPPLHSERT